jgi:hypothetical protein
MRSHHVIAIAAVLVVGFAIKAVFFPSHPAEAEPQRLTSPSIDVLQMHVDYANMKNLPEQSIPMP